jgi:hypothetical protein
MTPFIYHLQAIHTLLQHSSERLWRGHEAGNTLRDVVATLGQRVSAVGRWSQFGAGGAVCKARKEEADKLHKVRFVCSCSGMFREFDAIFLVGRILPTCSTGGSPNDISTRGVRGAHTKMTRVCVTERILRTWGCKIAFLEMSYVTSRSRRNMNLFSGQLERALKPLEAGLASYTPSAKEGQAGRLDAHCTSSSEV